MTEPRIVLYLAALDRSIARRDGRVDRLPALGPENHGCAQFLSAVDTVIRGRTTYEQVLTFGPYPCQGSRAMSSARAAGLRSAPGKDIWPVGGARLAQDFLHAKAVNTSSSPLPPTSCGRASPSSATGPIGRSP